MIIMITVVSLYVYAVLITIADMYVLELTVTREISFLKSVNRILLFCSFDSIISMLDFSKFQIKITKNKIFQRHKTVTKLNFFSEKFFKPCLK